MFCEKCGKQINDDAAFCPYCGQSTSSDKQTRTEADNSSASKKTPPKKSFLIISAVIILVMVFVLNRSSSVEKELIGYWVTSYTSDGNTIYNQLDFKKVKSGLVAKSTIMVDNEKSETIYSDAGISFEGEVIIDEKSSSILIQNSKMGATMKLHYTKDGKNLSLSLDEYWCKGGDPFINNQPPNNLAYSKKK